jgi:hypothetical protein
MGGARIQLVVTIYKSKVIKVSFMRMAQGIDTKM